MKLWKIFLVATTAMILPLALVSVGYAQELNCWGLRPVRTDAERPSEYSSQSSSPEKKEREEWTDDPRCYGNAEPDNEI